MRKIYYSKSLEVNNSDKLGSIENPLYSLKRDLILFDHIVYPYLGVKLDLIYHLYNRLIGPELKIHIAEFERLKDMGIVIDYKISGRNNDIKILKNTLNDKELFLYESFLSMSQELAHAERKLYEQYTYEANPLKRQEALKIFIHRESMRESLMSLLATMHMQHIDNFDAVNSQIIQKGYPIGQKMLQSVEKPTVYQFLLNDLPFPSDITPWQDISDYKSEIDSHRRLATLRNWLNKVIKGEYTVNELVDEYEDFYLNFEEAMKRHTIKTKKSLLKILVVGGAEILEDVVKLRLKNITEKIFKTAVQATAEHVKLTEAEASAPGKELAYMFFSKEKFNS